MVTTKFRIFCFILSITAFYSAAGQTKADSVMVRQSMEAYLNAFYEGDSLSIIHHFSPQIIKYGYYKAKDSASYAGEPMSFQEMMDYAVRVKKRGRKLPDGTVRKVEIYDIQDQTASGKVTAWWGTDYILLAKENEKWMIRQILWQGPLKK